MSTSAFLHRARWTWRLGTLVGLLGLLLAAPAWADKDEDDEDDDEPKAVESFVNGDIEGFDPLMPGEPAGWETNAWGEVEASFTWLDATITPGASHHGDHALRVDATAPDKPPESLQGDAKWWPKPFPVAPGTGKYKLSHWYRSNVETRSIAWVTDGGSQTQFFPLGTHPAASKWTHVNTTLSIPEWATHMRVMHVIDRTGWLETDSYSALREPSPKKQRALVSLTFDDGWVTAYAYLVNQMDKRGIKGTHFIITEYMDKPGYTADYIGAKKVKELLANGHEVGSHTLLHDDMSKVSPEVLNENLELSKARLENLGAKVVSFAWPYGFFLPEQAERAHKTYNLVRTVQAGINVPPYNTKELFGFVVTNTATVAEIEEAVKQTEEMEGAWLILIYHRASEEAPNSAYVTPQSFIDTLDMLQKRNADIRPMGSVLGIWEPVPLPPEPTKEKLCCKAFDPPEPFTPSTSLTDKEGGASDESAGCTAGRVPAAPIALVLLALAGLATRRRRAWPDR